MRGFDSDSESDSDLLPGALRLLLDRMGRGRGDSKGCNLSSICLQSVSNFYAHVARNHRKPQVVRARALRLVRQEAQAGEERGEVATLAHRGKSWQHWRTGSFEGGRAGNTGEL